MDEYIIDYTDVALDMGVFGYMFKGQKRSTSEMVSVKRSPPMPEGIPASILREISNLKELQHNNLVCLKDVFHGDDFNLYLIFEYVPMDLKTYLRVYEKGGMSSSMIKCYLYQMALGLKFCHERRIIHRGLVPVNVLIDNSGTVKLSGFSAGRLLCFPIQKVYSPLLMKYRYHAPECLTNTECHATKYSEPIDIWSLGCIFGEMATGRPLFNGISRAQQIELIVRMISEDSSPGSEPVARLSKRVPLRGNAYNLLESMLKWDFNERISARNTLKHEFFADFDKKLIVPKFVDSTPEILLSLAKSEE